jgi:hypothetical protein
MEHSKTFHAQIRELLELALEQIGKPDEENPHGAILAAESLIRQAAAAATGYKAISSQPGWF